VDPGTLVDGKYRVERKLGEGGMASVYAATQLHLNERVALKVLLPALAGDPTVVERFMREARAAARLKSEHVVLILDVGSLPTRQPYIVMEFLDGRDLDVVLQERGRIPPSEAVDYVLQVCEALAEAHSAGIVHRDIKPSNCVLVKRRTGEPLVKVLDFGIAKLMLGDDGPRLTATKATMGTPAFMSPEQIRGAKDVDHRADIWSLGITLFQLVTGNLPFGGNTYAKLVMSVSREPTPQIPAHPALNAVLQGCLAKDRNERFSTVGDVAVALEPFAGDRVTAAALVARCVALVPKVRVTTPAAAGTASSTPAPVAAPVPTPAAGYPMPTPASGYPMLTPPHGAVPMTTPPHGGYPMTTPPHGAAPHGGYPMTTPPHGGYPMTTPPHGGYPMTTPPHGGAPMTTPPHGAAPMTTPPHGALPMTTPPAVVPAPKKRGALVAIIVLVLVAAGIALVAVLGGG
jgi:eukaryotic-like serine/threonine-protein kinase